MNELLKESIFGSMVLALASYVFLLQRRFEALVRRSEDRQRADAEAYRKLVEAGREDARATIDRQLQANERITEALAQSAVAAERGVRADEKVEHAIRLLREEFIRRG